MWPSPDGKGFYIFGGGASYGINVKNLDKSGIWKFVVDGDGDDGTGKWEIETPVPTSPAPLRTLRLTEQAAFVATTGGSNGGGGLGFSVGGTASAWTDPSNPKSDHISGMVVYDMNRKEWRNETAVGFTTGNGSLRGGAGVFVPSFGNAGEEEKNNGLVFILGGSVFAVPATTKDNQPDFVMGFDNVTFFDPVSREWYWQTTTGERPSSRERFCAVGVEGRNGTYEMCVLLPARRGGKLSVILLFFSCLRRELFSKLTSGAPLQIHVRRCRLKDRGVV